MLFYSVLSSGALLTRLALNTKDNSGSPIGNL